MKVMLAALKKINYKYSLAIGVGLFFLALIIIAHTWLTTGDWIRKSIDLSGGTEIIVQTPNKSNIDLVEKTLQEKFKSADVRAAEYGFIVRTDDKTNSTEVLDTLHEININVAGASVQTTGPALGAAFWGQAQLAILLAFAFMAVVIYFIYRATIPTLAMVLSAFMDMTGAIAVADLFGLQLSLAGLAALLMLVGYSVDTDCVLATRTLKSDAADREKNIRSSIRTGLTMTGTTLVALTALLLLAPASALKEIAIILVAGLFFDVVNTWITNVALMRWYLESRDKKL